MSLNSSGYPNVPKSITDPSVSIKDSLDSGNPMSFLAFIKIIDSSFDGETLQDYYNAYLREWNLTKNGESVSSNSIIIERYREFIQDINLSYTTPEERKFLNQIDFNDPLDLDVAIPFYTRKLIEIASYYNKKREETKNQIIKYKTGSTNLNIPKDIINITLNYLEDSVDGKLKFDYDTIKSKIEVEVEELYDTYPLYFNQTPDETFFDKKDLDYGLDIFLKDNGELVEEVFGGVSEQLRDIKESESLFDNKRALSRKYLATDFYYLSTGSSVTDFLSGKILDADNPTANFLNINYPTTASTDRKNLITPRERGFFRPHKTSIVLVDGKNYSYSFNFENLEPNSIYYFPDPLIHGINGDVLLFIDDDSNLKRNDSSGFAKNQPTTSKDSSKYYGYVSQTELTPSKYLDKIFESGYIQDSKQDIYGNLFGIFKNDGSFKQNITIESETYQYYTILNGHTFYDYDYGEGYSFDYTTFDDSTLPYTTRSGVSAYTGGFATDFSRYYSIFGGTFQNDDFYYPEGFLPSYQIMEGASFMNGSLPLVDTISSDLSAYPLSGSFYYDRLLEGGIYTESPLQRALLDPLYPSLTANMTQEVIPDGINVFSIDGGKFNQFFEDYSNDIPSIYYDPSILVTSSYVLSSAETKNYFSRYNVKGGIYVRNSNTKVVDKLENSLTYLSTTLPMSTYNEVVSNVNRFEIVDDTIFIETTNNLIVSKIGYVDGDFINPKTQTYVFKYNETPFQKVSLRYKKDGSVYFAIINTVEYPLSSNDFQIYPTIYKFDIKKHTYESFTPSVDDNYYVYGGSTTYVLADQPTFTYNSRNNIYNISFLVKDVSKNFSLEEFDFEMGPFNMLTHNQFKQN